MSLLCALQYPPNNLRGIACSLVPYMRPWDATSSNACFLQGQSESAPSGAT